MTRALPKTAREIERSASWCAQAAAEELLDTRPEAAERFSQADPLESWRLHFYDRIKELATAVGTGRPTLFADHVTWARQALDARKSDASDLFASLRVLGGVLKERLSPAAQRSVDEYLQGAVQALSASEAAPASALDATVPAQRLAIDYVRTALEGNMVPAKEMVLERLGDPFSLRQLLLDVLLPAQVEVGRLWHANRVSVVEEHLITQTTKRIMAVLANRAPRKPDNGKTVIATTAPGNDHELGLQAIAYLLEIEGWRTLYLGADVPSGDLPTAARHFNADLIIISASMATQLPGLETCLTNIREISSARIVVGGRAFAAEPELWRDIGADGYAADAEAFLDSVDDLVKAPT